MTRRQLLCVLCVALCRAAHADIDKALYQLGAELAASARQANARSIAVPEFICGGSKESLTGQTGALGRYAAEEVERVLIQQAQDTYAVADRRNLDKVMKEMQINISSLVNEMKACAELGKMRGLDTLAVGTLTRMGRTLKIQCKLIHLETTDVKGSSRQSVPIDGDLLAMFGSTAYVAPPAKQDTPRKQQVNLMPWQPAVEALQEQALATGPATVETVPYQFEILDRWGQLWPTKAQGRRRCIAARKGQTYSVRLTNNTDRRVAVALHIDGINALDQKRGRPSRGPKWVIKPRSSHVVRGWQKNLSLAREFLFVDLADSVAGRMNFTDSIGLITATFYREREKPLTRGGIGVGEGDEIEVKIRYVKMEHEDTPIAIQSVHYGRAPEAK